MFWAPPPTITLKECNSRALNTRKQSQQGPQMTPSVCVYRDMWARLGRLSALHVQQAHMLMIITHLRASSVHPTPHTHRRGRMISMHASATPGFQVPTAVHVCPVLRGASREGVGVRAVWCARSTPSPPKQAKSVLRAQATLLRPKRVSVSTNAYVTPGSDTWGRGVRLVCLVPSRLRVPTKLVSPVPRDFTKTITAARNV